MFRSKKERDFWVEIIKDTRNKWMENQRRLQEQRRKISLANPDLLDDKTPTDPNISFLTLKDQTPTNGDSSKGTSKNVLPVWIPNREATKCMMFECGFKFTTIVRRHHCRQCGLIICNKCSAKAPVKFMEFSVKRVCSECYDKILDDCKF
jgi:FYVE/RhoGEF/PH domain-containing protein 5/6